MEFLLWTTATSTTAWRARDRAGTTPRRLICAAELPFGKGKRFLNHGGLIDRIVGGFQINAIHRYRSNIALIPLIGGPRREFLDLAGYGGNLRPNLTGQPFRTDITAVSATSYRDINPNAFTRPPDFRGTTAAIGSAEYRAYYADPLRFFGNAAPTNRRIAADRRSRRDIPRCR